MILISILLTIAVAITHQVVANDITNIVFNPRAEGLIAAFGDFNSDELTDVFMIKNNGKTIQIYLGSDVEPLLREGPRCDFEKLVVTSIVPGDFDGDAFMDLLVVTRTDKPQMHNVYVNWGGSDFLNCTDESQPFVEKMRGEPVALDFNSDMIIDLFGMDREGNKTYWIFKKDRKQPDLSYMKENNSELRIPHSNAYIDLNDDYTADLFVATKTNFEVWSGLEREGFKFSHKIDLPVGSDFIIGQTAFLDVELKGQMNILLPICFDAQCKNSTLLVFAGNNFHNLNVIFKDPDNQQLWGFMKPDEKSPYTNTITIRGGDYNMDGYPDLLATLVKLTGGQPQTFLLENVPCKTMCGRLTRTFEVRWKALAPFANGTVAGAFYDFYQDGILDVILIENVGDKYRPVAFRNTLDYDANFVKVIVLTGLTNSRDPTKLTPLGRKKRTYGTNLPGPKIAYYTTTQDGDIQHGSSAQIPQSAYFSLHLPYTIFGLGRTPNFVDSLTVGLSNRSRTWTQLIPNSQMIVVPTPTEDPAKWKAQLFVTPSKLILMSVIALGGTCLFILVVILVLHVKEKREDKIEKLQEAHRFHFDAM